MANFTRACVGSRSVKRRRSGDGLLSPLVRKTRSPLGPRSMLRIRWVTGSFVIGGM